MTGKPFGLIVGVDIASHGLSLERIALDAPHEVTDLYGSAPPLGVPFVEVIASADGYVLLVGGVRLPDNHIERRSVERMPTEAARKVASALLRAADVSFREPAKSVALAEEPEREPIWAAFARPPEPTPGGSR